MKLTLVFLCALFVVSYQQIQQRPRGVIWFSPYYSPQQPINGYQAHYYNAPYINQEFAKGQLASQDNVMDENDDYQSRILTSFGQPQQQNNARLFFNSNPFAAAMSAPTVTSTMTVITSIVTCVPLNNFLNAAQPKVCVSRRRRDTKESVDAQFPILPSKTLKLIPTALPSPYDMRREKRLLPTIDQSIDESIISSKNDVTLSKMANADHINLREKRFFFNKNALMSVSTSFVFVPTMSTQTVNLVSIESNVKCTSDCAPCLPAGYIICK